MYKFADKYGCGKPYNYIHPYKQEAVKMTLERVPSWVEWVILFGSAIHPMCRQDSDIDLVVVGDNQQEPTDSFVLETHDYDILHYKDVESFLEKVKNNPFSASSQAYQKGVVIYAR